MQLYVLPLAPERRNRADHDGWVGTSDTQHIVRVSRRPFIQDSIELILAQRL